MVAAVSLPQPEPSRDQRILVSASWKDYVLLREALEIPGLRMTYLRGALELMSPSRAHERKKTTIARLVETYAVLLRLPLIGYGSTTFRKRARERGAEPDECWCVGRQMRDDEFPDIVLEVIETAPLLDKLDVYDGFEVPEVWLFVFSDPEQAPIENGTFAIHRRRKTGGYQRGTTSRLLPALDFKRIARYAEREDQDVALSELADEIERSKKKRRKRRR